MKIIFQNYINSIIIPRSLILRYLMFKIPKLLFQCIYSVVHE